MINDLDSLRAKHKNALDRSDSISRLSIYEAIEIPSIEWVGYYCGLYKLTHDLMEKIRELESKKE